MNISHLTFFLLLFTGLVALNLTMTPATYGQDGPVVVYGDSRAGHDIHRDIVSAIIAEHPAVVLHESAHAYHDQILGFDHPEIIALES